MTTTSKEKFMEQKYMTQQELCDAFGIARSTMYDRMKKNGMTNYADYHTEFLIKFLEQELKEFPVRTYRRG